MNEYRSIPRERVAAVVDDAKNHLIRTTVTPYGVVDEYKTRWVPGVWTRSLEERKPPMCWAHQWEEPIGSLVDFNDSDKRLETLHKLSDFEAVPRARQAYAQFQDGTLTDASFGFSRSKDEPDPKEEGVYNILEARLDEVSPVLRGAVPGAKMTGTRGVPVDTVLQLARGLEQGDMTLDQALAMVATAAASDGTRSMHTHAKKGGGKMSHSHMSDHAMHGHTDLLPMMGRAATGGLPSPVNDAGDDVVPCPKCAAENEADALYCDQCGASMAGATNSQTLTDRSVDETEARSLLADVATR